MTRDTDLEAFGRICGDCAGVSVLDLTPADVRTQAAVWGADEDQIQAAIRGLAIYQKDRSSQYMVVTNAQSANGYWVIFADEAGTKCGMYDNPDDVRKHLRNLGLSTVAMDVDGNGTIRQVPVEWIGDGLPLVGSERALALVGR